MANILTLKVDNKVVHETDFFSMATPYVYINDLSNGWLHVDIFRNATWLGHYELVSTSKKSKTITYIKIS